MVEKFSADEVFEIAEQLERNGAKFYRKAADKTEKPDERKMLENLASMEEEHEKIFARLRAEAAARENLKPLFDPEGLGALYLQAIADGHVFDLKGDASDLISGKETMTEILQNAIVLEKDSIVFYVGIRNALPKDWGRDQIERIIDEEPGHVIALSNRLAVMGGNR
jgi:rubrerythrin